ncbi:uncharacterized protein ASPGLDRAFT_36205 [Aspergillus glaucus CBS 516.65]|uniref:Uncharacterized protein n=1 Tax=Aspergillus glaucus CBS 516.65 TaxID=1160497 RepID=A0A1L9VHP4_ASPGL|nr:hypothetical protein ASPGLDRAFT_36205 [Aspergillus glaucus CBS 516.65]OJJ83448.1 hypothetical protein ASPGLDRAFT_36205 [Aspergillus glaucus CBS 516.65]
MPLTVPKITGSEADRAEWLSKLVGKKIGKVNNATTFAEKNLPRVHRILRPDDGYRLDYRSDRLNVYLDEEDVVRNVRFF